MEDMDLLIGLSILIFALIIESEPKTKVKKRRRRRRKSRAFLSLFFREKTDWEKTCDDGGRFFGW